ncbi:MAG: hypothetical protein FWD65_00765 [Coriobacteriia bacterium]|nr:hypothetical protein [Coriobacteriia bacterium]
MKKSLAFALTMALLAGAFLALAPAPASAQAASLAPASAPQASGSVDNHDNHAMGSTIAPDASHASVPAPQRTGAPLVTAPAPLPPMLAAAPPNIYPPDASLPRTDAVDVASWQSWMTQADFNTLKLSGVKYVVVKLTEGTTYSNPYAAQQIAYAKAAGLKVAAYHYVYDPNSIAAEARHFAARADALGLPISTMMIEDAEGTSSGYDWTAASLTFAKTLNAAGFANVRYYCSLSWVTSGVMNATTLGPKNMWIAQYFLSTPSSSALQNTTYGAWQYSSRAYFTGMSASAALDVSIQYRSDFFTVPASAPVPPPATPLLGSAKPGASSVTITWHKIAGIDGYYLYRKAGAATSWTKIAKVAPSATSYIDSKVSGATKYAYTLRAYKGSLLSSYNPTGVSATFVATPALKSVINGKGYTKFTWGKVAGAQGYRVYRRTAATGSSWVRMAVISGDSITSYVDKKVTSGVAHAYMVRAYTGSSTGGYKSPGIYIRYLNMPQLKPAVRAKSGSNAIKVTWVGSKNADGYYVYRKRGSSGWTRVASVGPAVRSWTDTKTSKGAKYTYTVRAWDKTTTTTWGTVASYSSRNPTGVSFKP